MTVEVEGPLELGKPEESNICPTRARPPVQDQCKQSDIMRGMQPAMETERFLLNKWPTSGQSGYITPAV